MSAIGPWRTLACALHMSAYDPKRTSPICVDRDGSRWKAISTSQCCIAFRYNKRYDQPMDHYAPTHVHLVGSIGLDTVDEVFSSVGPLLGHRLRRIPDGEPGPRRLWVSFQYPLLRSSPFLRPDPSGAVRKTSGFPLLCLADGVTADEVSFGELGYAREARASYLDFTAARKCGDISPNTRFQVCLPTPMSVIYAFCTARDVAAVEQAYEKAMTREIEAISKSIPHNDLCIQWDVCHDMIVWDGQPQDQFPLVNTSKQEIADRFARICGPIPDDVELGFHLCYGDFGGKHFFDPVTARHLVDIANALAASVKHKIAYIHLPVPISRATEDFFAPMRDFRLTPETEIYLGLIHATDGIEGAKKRIELAAKYVPRFGIATECGFARARKKDVVRTLLDIHKGATAQPPAI
jgi:methionine synthase II (cobalamin-independent)